MARVKKNDVVEVISGKDKGKQGAVIEILSKKGKIIVKDIGVVTRHVKARRQGEIAGIKKEERPILLSKVMPVCSTCKKPCRVNAKILEDGKKVRSCNRCKEAF